MTRNLDYRGVAQLVAHTVWDREVAGSSPVAPTIRAGMKYAFVIIAILALWVGMILLVMCDSVTGIFLPSFAVAMTVILFLVGFGKKK